MSKNRTITSLFWVALLIVLSGITLAACGANPSQPTTGSLSTPIATNSAANGSTPVPAHPSTNNTFPTSVPTSSAVNNAPPTATPEVKAPANVQNCGKIQLSALHRFEDAGLAQQAGACFWQAFQHCQAAALTFQPLSVDTIVIHTFLVERKEGGCAITDTVSHAIVPQAPTVTSRYTCTGVTNTNGALRFTSCGAEGDVLVPLVQ